MASLNLPKAKDHQIRFVCLGNSMQYYNDCPRLIEMMCRGKATQDSCFRGGATLSSLLLEGNGMDRLWQTRNALCDDGVTHDTGAKTVRDLLSSKCNYVIMNDHSQNPVRRVSQQQSLEVLKSGYLPLLLHCGGTPILLVTPAYRSPTKGSQDLGDHTEFTRRLIDGYRMYADALSQSLPPHQSPIIAPLGPAFLIVRRERYLLWRELYHDDDYHPSPKGTFLQACVLYITMYRRRPVLAMDNIDGNNGPNELWASARAMSPPWEKRPVIPTLDEIDYLCDVAARVCDTECDMRL